MVDKVSTLKPSDVEITIPEENMYGSSLGIGEKMWLPFTIQIPPDVVTPMEVCTKNQTLLLYNECCIHDFLLPLAFNKGATKLHFARGQNHVCSL